MLHDGSVGVFQNKDSTLYFNLLFWHFFIVFYHKNCVFIIFISFFDGIKFPQQNINQSET